MSTAFQIPDNFTSAKQLFAYFGVIPPTPKEDWRLLLESKRRTGQINALPGFVGKAWATNGILVAIVTSGGELKLGHLDWFTPDAQPHTVSIRTHRSNTISKRIAIEYV